MKERESDIQKAILGWLQLHGISADRINNMGVPTKDGKFRPARRKGISDIIGVIPREGDFGIPLYIEVKAPGKKPTPEQEEYLSEKDRAGALCLVATSVEFVEKQLKSFL